MAIYKSNIRWYWLLILHLFGCDMQSTPWEPLDRHRVLPSGTVAHFERYYLNPTLRDATLDVAVAISNVIAVPSADDRTLLDLKQSIECLNQNTSFLSRDMKFVNSIMISNLEDAMRLRKALERFSVLEPVHLLCPKFRE